MRSPKVTRAGTGNKKFYLYGLNGSVKGRRVIVIGASGGCEIAGFQLAKLLSA